MHEDSYGCRPAARPYSRVHCCSIEPCEGAASPAPLQDEARDQPQLPAHGPRHPCLQRGTLELPAGDSRGEPAASFLGTESQHTAGKWEGRRRPWQTWSFPSHIIDHRGPQGDSHGFPEPGAAPRHSPAGNCPRGCTTTSPLPQEGGPFSAGPQAVGRAQGTRRAALSSCGQRLAEAPQPLGSAGPTDMGSGWATSRRCSTWFGEDKVIHSCNAKTSPCHMPVP